MRKKKSKMIRANAGITLIVLIITVIVMLILAAVAINIAIGEHGLINRTEGTAGKYQQTQEDELAILNRVDSKYQQTLNRIGGGDIEEIPLPSPTEPIPTTNPTPSPTTTPTTPGKPDENGIYTENSTTNGEEGNAFNPEVPKGFKPKDEGDAVWGKGDNPPTEEAVKAGLIIEDEEGNQFVWIAVDGETVKLSRYTFDTDGTEKEHGDGRVKSYYQELAEPYKGNPGAKDINAFKTSVTEHGGYYMARYEASYGTDGKPNSKISTGTPNASSGEENSPTTEGQLWNNITQPNASAAGRIMYDERVRSDQRFSE